MARSAHSFIRAGRLLELPDGSLLLTDDGNGRIYRIAFTAPAPGK